MSPPRTPWTRVRKAHAVVVALLVLAAILCAGPIGKDRLLPIVVSWPVVLFYTAVRDVTQGAFGAGSALDLALPLLLVAAVAAYGIRPGRGAMAISITALLVWFGVGIAFVAVFSDLQNLEFSL